MKTIALSAGHHKQRQGASNKNYNLTEYVCASKVVQIAANKLKTFGVCDVKLIDGTLRQKVEYINRNHFALALDYHFNADAELADTDDNIGDGCMVMYIPGSATRRAQAAALASDIAITLDVKDKGAREGWYWGGDNPGTIKDYFLRKTNCPAFIPEPGYIDNNGFCEQFLLNDDGYEKLADALVLSVTNFLK